MWYSIIPSFTIITAAVAIPNMFTHFSNLMYLGQPFRRSITSNLDCYYHLRDSKFTGKITGYSYQGLDGISDVQKS